MAHGRKPEIPAGFQETMRFRVGHWFMNIGWCYHVWLHLKYGWDVVHSDLTAVERAYYAWRYGPRAKVNDYFYRVPPGGRRVTTADVSDVAHLPKIYRTDLK